MIRNVAIETNTNLKKAVSRGKIMGVEPEVIKSSFTGLMNFLSGYYATPIELPLGPMKRNSYVQRKHSSTKVSACRI